LEEQGKGKGAAKPSDIASDGDPKEWNDFGTRPRSARGKKQEVRGRETPTSSDYEESKVLAQVSRGGAAGHISKHAIHGHAGLGLGRPVGAEA
jgi:hypothetical protein